MGNASNNLRRFFYSTSDKNVFLNSMSRILFCLIVLFPLALSAQQLKLPDTKYLEDQIYLGLNYNFLLNRPEDVNQRNLSYGIYGGIIKDLPLNANRTIGLGIGLGYGLNAYYSNLIAADTDLGITYSLPDTGVDLKRSKLETHTVEFPIEFRWRNSNPETYKFWRIYTGIKLGYIFSGRSKVITASGKNSFENGHIQNFQYGAILNIGYNTFNFHAYYGFNEILNSDLATFNGTPIVIKPLRLGVIFYIL